MTTLLKKNKTKGTRVPSCDAPTIPAITIDEVIQDLRRELRFYENFHIVGFRLAPIYQHFLADSDDEKGLVSAMRRTIEGMAEAQAKLKLKAA